MDTWQQVLDIVERNINPQSYNTWFKPTQFIKYEGKALYVRVPNGIFVDWLNEHLDVVIDAARLAGLGDVEVIYITEKAAEAVQPTQGRLDFESIDKFTNEVINAIRYDKMLSFKERYRSNDVLLIDDIQFIAGKERTQEEFFHTFNSLYDTHKQIIISADCPPREIPTLEERL